MRVSDVQELLGLVRQMLAAGGGGKGAGELAEFSAALDPYREMTPKQFAAALRKPTEGPKPGRKGGKLSAAEVDAAIAAIKVQYDRAGSPARPRPRQRTRRESSSSSRKTTPCVPPRPSASRA